MMVTWWIVGFLCSTDSITIICNRTLDAGKEHQEVTAVIVVSKRENNQIL